MNDAITGNSASSAFASMFCGILDFGEARLLAVVNPLRGAETDQLVAGVCAAVRDFAADAEVADDVTVLGPRYFG